MSGSQFNEDSSISKLMAVAMQMDSEGSDLPFQWGTDSNAVNPVSTMNAKLERDNAVYPPNVDCWNMQSGPPSFNNSYNFGNQTSNYSPVHQNGSMVAGSDLCHVQNGAHTLSNSMKPMQDHFRQNKFSNFTSEKYQEMEVKAETCESNKWNTCAITSNSHSTTFETLSRTKPIEDHFPPKSFTSVEKGGEDGIGSLKQVTSTSSADSGPKVNLFSERVDSDSDSKTSGTDTNSQNGIWGPMNPALDIDVNQMINSGVTVGGYKPRKIISKRKKSSVPSEAKDKGYWEKRKKNNDSARRSREAKKEKERNFYKRALELEYENHCLKERVLYLERKLDMIVQQNPNLNISDV